MKRRQSVAKWTLLIAVAAPFVVLVWVHGRAKYGQLFVNRGDPLPAFDVFITWRDYDGWDEEKFRTDDVVLIWNGTDLGRGPAAANEVVRRMQRVPAGSRVLIYPRYEEAYGARSRMPPSPLLRPDFNAVAQDRRLTLIWSPYDHLGRLRADAYNGVDDPPNEPSRMPATAPSGPTAGG